MAEAVGGASRFEHFYCAEAQIARVKSGVDFDQPVHAYLFCGPSGTGKRTMARICARALNCAMEAKPCDVCGSCRRYLNGSHPDNIEVASKKPIGVDDVRNLIGRLSMRPYEGGRLTVIIERADSMTVQAQNALLKTLEEPPGRAVLFLLALSAAPLLPTVLSRTRLVRFLPLERDKCALALQKLGVKEDRARLLADAAEGSVGRALALDADEEYWDLRERVLRALNYLTGPGGVAAAFDIIKDDKDRAREALIIMEQRARELMCDNERRDGARGLNLPGDKLLSGVISARRLMASNVSWQSAVEMMFFELTAPAAFSEGGKA